MADKKRTKLSLKRKTIGLSNKSLLFNSFGQKQKSLVQSDVTDKGAENIIVNLSSDSDTDVDLQDHQSLHPKKRSRFSEAPSHSDGHQALPIQPKPVRVSSETSKPSFLLGVDEDLCKLRMMFLKLRKPRTDVRTLSDLPDFASKQNVQAPESDEHDPDSTELSPLPPMCKWCLRRKPIDYSKLYNDLIKQELQTSVTVSSADNHQRVLLSSTKGDNYRDARSIHLEKERKSRERELSAQAKNTNFITDTCSFPNSSSSNNLNKFTSVLNNPTLKENRYSEKEKHSEHTPDNLYLENQSKIGFDKFSCFHKQTEKENTTGLVKSQPMDMKIHSGDIKKLPNDLKNLSENNKGPTTGHFTTQGEYLPPYRNVVHSIERKNNQKPDDVTLAVRASLILGHIDREKHSLQQSVPVNKVVPTVKSTDSVRNTPCQPNSTETKPAFPGRTTENKPAYPGRTTKNKPAFHGRTTENKPAFPGRTTQNKSAFPGRTTQNKPAFPGRTTENKPAFPGRTTENKPAFHGRTTENKPAFPGRTTETKPAFPGRTTETKPAFPGRTTETKPAFPGRTTENKADVKKPESDVQSCPLCQKTFDKGATQMDIDGHIAVCLSMSGDDVTW